MWHGRLPQSLMCFEVKHRLMSLAPGLVTTQDFSDDSSLHVHVFQANRTLPHNKNCPIITFKLIMISDEEALKYIINSMNL